MTLSIENIHIRLSDQISFPADIVTRTLGIFAIRGAGKTYTALKLMEEMVIAGLPVVFLDPLGVAWGIRSSADGEGPGLPVVIFGGRHGDYPLVATSGAAMAELTLRIRRPLVLDLSGLKSIDQQRLFVADYLDYLHLHNTTPLHLILDEADVFAPQQFVGKEAVLRSLNAVDTLVRRDRAYGLGETLITQRPASLNISVREQIEALIALRTMGTRSRKALRDIVEQNATEAQVKQFLATLATQPNGTAWIWSPEWLQAFEQVQIGQRQTFDSSQTPKVGVETLRPQHLAPIDLPELQEALEQVVEEVAASDPAQLRARIAELEAQLKQEREARKGKRGLQKGTPVGPFSPETGNDAHLKQMEALRTQLTELEQAKETLAQENLQLREQIKTLTARQQAREDGQPSPQWVTLPTSLPIAEAIVEHVHLGQHAASALLLPSQDSAALAAQISQLQHKVVAQEHELVQKENLIEQLRADLERKLPREEAPTVAKQAERASASSLTPEQNRLVTRLIQDINALKRFPRQIFRLVLFEETEVSFREIAARLRKTQEEMRNVRMGPLLAMHLLEKSATGYTSCLQRYCRERLQQADATLVRDRLLREVRE